MAFVMAMQKVVALDQRLEMVLDVVSEIALEMALGNVLETEWVL